MEAKHLTQLAVIVELGSVTKAARRLKLTQPTLSQTIKLIETEVGGAVLRRWRYGVTPTEIGARLSDEGREIIQRSERARRAIHEWQHGLSGELRIGVGPMLAATIMGDFFADTLENPPAYGLKIVCEYAARLVDRLNNDQLDVAIIPYELNRNDDGFTREKLFEDQLQVLVGQANPLANHTTVSPQDLSKQHWISISESTGLFDNTRETLDLLGLNTITPSIENTGDVNMIFRILERGNACSVLPYQQLQLAKPRFDIVPLNLDVDLPSQNFGLWATNSGWDRPEIADCLDRLKVHMMKIGLV